MPKNKPLVTLKIQAYRDREAIITALANSGYVVTVKEKELWPSGTDYYVVVWNTPKGAEDAG